MKPLLVIMIALLLAACSNAYYGGLEKIGIPKRDVMVYRVGKARDTQQQTKEQFKSALAQFAALTHYQGGDLENIYNRLNNQYEDSVKQANLVEKRINDIEDVSDALFKEWESEIMQYSNAEFKRSSQQKLNTTRQQYRQLITAMKQAEAKLPPILSIFKDHVLFLKHNLNAHAVASLKNELSSMQSNVNIMVSAMEKSINEADAFIKTMEAKG